METIEDVQNNLSQNFLMVKQIVNIGSDVGDLLVEILNDLKKHYEDLPGFIPFKEKLDRTIKLVQMVKEDERLKSKYEIIRNQAIVLLVENFESFLNDCVKILVDSYPGTIEWPDKKKTLPVSTDVLRYSVPTVGDLVLASLKKEEVNFQDLQSTLRFFEEYLGLTLNLSEDNRDRIIYAQAFRNIVVHNGSKVDHRFLAQIRNTRFATAFKNGEEILLSDEEYLKFLESFQSFSEIICGQLSDKVHKQM